MLGRHAPIPLVAEQDTSKEPQEYRITVHLFAAAFSLAYVNYTPKTTADDNEDELGFTPADLL